MQTVPFLKMTGTNKKKRQGKQAFQNLQEGKAYLPLYLCIKKSLTI